MRRLKEQRRRFHEALINTLYPPPPKPSPPSITVNAERNEDDEPVNITPQEIPEDNVSDEERSTSNDGGGGGGGEEDGKLTRSQRKKMRKRKLKEDSTRRGKLIGPLLPVTDEENDPQVGDGASSSIGKNKVKQRRKARKLVNRVPESADAEKLIGDADGGGRCFS